MAKLQDVKIIEASGGKVTEIERDGTTYKIARNTTPKDGDILRSQGVYDAEEGSFYNAIKRGGPIGVSVIYDDVGDMRSNLDEFDVFRAPEPALKVGDYAKFVREDVGTGGKGVVGAVVELVGVGRRFDFQFLRVSDGQTSYTDAQYLTKATEEEVAEATEQAKKAKLTEVFAQFGREDGEFKEGDLVRVTEDHAGGSRNKKGDIGEIVTVEQTSPPYEVRVPARNGDASGMWHRAKSIELLAPVESRVDTYA